MNKNVTVGHYIVTRVVKDKREPARYQRSGWIVFDTFNPLSNHPFYASKREAIVFAKTCLNHGKDLA